MPRGPGGRARWRWRVAIDRRAWCRVETGFDGVEVESKDTLQRTRAARLEDVDASGASSGRPRPRGAPCLRSRRRRARRDAGEGAGGAPGSAARRRSRWRSCGALARALGRETPEPEVERMAVRGRDRGARVATQRPRTSRPPSTAGALTAEPGCGPASGRRRPRGGRGVPASGGVRSPSRRRSPQRSIRDRPWRARARRARRPPLRGPRVGLWPKTGTPAAVCPGGQRAGRARIASLLRPAGAGLRACGGGRGTVVAVVAAPGERGAGTP